MTRTRATRLGAVMPPAGCRRPHLPNPSGGAEWPPLFLTENRENPDPLREYNGLTQPPRTNAPLLDVHLCGLTPTSALTPLYMARRRRRHGPRVVMPGRLTPRYLPTPHPGLFTPNVSGREPHSFASRLARLPRTPLPGRVLSARTALRMLPNAFGRSVRRAVRAGVPSGLKAITRRYRQLRALGRMLKPARETPCQRRAQRRQVIFANQVAGRSWGSAGGPRMANAHRTLNSNYTCR